MGKLILEFKNVSDAERPIVGEKAYNLCKLYNDGFKVPEGFVLSAQFFEEFLRYNNLTLNGDLHEKILQGDFPPELHYLLKASVDNLWEEGKKSLACRSSSTSEDNPNCSFAGQFCTLLGITNFEDLLEGIKICWAEFFNSRIESYSKNFNITASPAVSLIIQTVVDAKKSGIAFSRCDAEGSIIECTFGLGIALTDGIVSPDKICINNGSTTYTAGNKKIGVFLFDNLSNFEAGDTVTIPNLEKNERAVRIIEKDPFGGIVYVSITGSLASSACLSQPELQLLQAKLESIKEKYGPQDVEWAIDSKGELFILQSRPITSNVNCSPQSQLHAARGEDVLLSGITAAMGKAQGEIKVVMGPSDFAKVAEGDILVCTATTPDYFDVLTKAAGVVSEEGGVLSHTAIVCRELGIPCITACEYATKRLLDYDFCLLDADNGVIKTAFKEDFLEGNTTLPNRTFENNNIELDPLLLLNRFLSHCLKHDKQPTLKDFALYMKSKLKVRGDQP